MEISTSVDDKAVPHKSGRGMYLFITLLSFLLLAWVFSIKPPLGSPDEATHLFRANSMAHGYILLEPTGETGVTGGKVDRAFGEAAIAFRDYVYTWSYKGSENFIETMRSLNWDKGIADIGLPTTAFYLPVVYIPQALSFFLGQKLGLNIYETYALISFVTFGVCLALFLAAWRIYPVPAFSLAVILLPMSVYQLFSPTIDGISLAVTCLAMSLFVKLLKTDKSLDKPYLLLALSLSIIVVAGSRANLVCMVFMPLWLFIVNRQKQYIAAFIIVTAITLGWIAFTVIGTHDPSAVQHSGLSNSQIMAYYIRHPLTLIKIVINTLTDHDKLVFYYKSLIGNLALLDAPISKTARTAYAVLLVLSLVASLIFGVRKKILASSVMILLLSLASISLVFAALLVQWSAFPTDIIEGVQGRYFLIPLVILGYALPQLRFNKKVGGLLLIVLSIASAYVVRVTLLDRYQNTINIPQDAEVTSDSSIYNVTGSDKLQLHIAPPNGKLKSIAILMANYRQTAKGTVVLRLCSAGQCAETQRNISNFSDNSYYEFFFDRPFTIRNSDLTLSVMFQADKGSSPVALWMFPEKKDNAVKLPKMQFRFKSLQ